MMVYFSKKIYWLTGLVCLGILLVSCQTQYSVKSSQHTGGYDFYIPNGIESKPQDINNACKILLEKNYWIPSLYLAVNRWNTSPEVILAIIHQESSFRADARPIPLGVSSAYGYAQALDDTWALYKKKAKRPSARRDSFHDAVDFVGWYATITERLNRVSKTRADRIYLNYHEGWGGYKRQTYKSKPWLIAVAAKVYARTQEFRNHLANCPIQSYESVLRSNPQAFTNEEAPVIEEIIQRGEQNPFPQDLGDSFYWF